jgi:IclR family pca regulon transcriptional regulator
MSSNTAAPTIAEEIDALAGPDFMTSLARGLPVLRQGAQELAMLLP